MKYLAFDLGASGGKIFRADFDGNTLRMEEVHRFSNAPLRKDGKIYWDFDAIYGGLKEGLKKAASDGGDYMLGIDTFCNDFVLLDGSGKPMIPVRSYRDPRTERCQKKIYEKTPPETLYEKTGNQTALFNTYMQLASMRIEGEGDLLDSADKLVFVPDYLISLLTGKAECEYTLASVSQMYDIRKKAFDRDILDAFGIREDLFPPVVAPGSVSGTLLPDVAEELGITGKVTVIHVCEHDTASAFLGAVLSDSMILSSGTWSVLGVECDGPVITRYGFVHNFANEGSCAGHHRLLHNIMGSWILQQIKSELESGGEVLSHADMAELAGKAEPFRYLIDVDDNSFYAPESMTDAVKEMCLEKYGSAPEDTGSIVRCVLESLAVRYALYASQLEKLTGEKYDKINVIGGGARNGLLNKFTASALGKPLTAGPYEATALGNILVQMMSAGEIGCIEEGRDIIKRSFEFEDLKPECESEWAENTEKFKDMYGVK